MTPKFLHKLLSLAILLTIPACGVQQYPYSRHDSFYSNGIQYQGDINSALFFETGFSPDLGSKRANVTRSWNGEDNVYQIVLPGGGGIWITDSGPSAPEKELKAGSVFSFPPSAIVVDNVTNPTHWHLISAHCADQSARMECFDNSVIRILDSGKSNKQKKAPISNDYWRSDDNVVRVFGIMKYYVCDEEAWRKNKRLSALLSPQKEFFVTAEREHSNWFTAGEALRPCDTKNNGKLLTKLTDGIWKTTDLPINAEHLYVGTTKYGNVHDFYNSGFEKENSLYFRKVLTSTGKVVEIPPNGAVTLAYDPTDKKIFVFGINQYDYMKFSGDE